MSGKAGTTGTFEGVWCTGADAPMRCSNTYLILCTIVIKSYLIASPCCMSIVKTISHAHAAVAVLSLILISSTSLNTFTIIFAIPILLTWVSDSAIGNQTPTRRTSTNSLICCTSLLTLAIRQTGLVPLTDSHNLVTVCPRILHAAARSVWPRQSVSTILTNWFTSITAITVRLLDANMRSPSRRSAVFPIIVKTYTLVLVRCNCSY